VSSLDFNLFPFPITGTISEYTVDMLARQYILPYVRVRYCCEVHSVGQYVRLSVRHTVDSSQTKRFKIS